MQIQTKNVYTQPATFVVAHDLPLMKDFGDWISNVSEPEKDNVISFRWRKSGTVIE